MIRVPPHLETMFHDVPVPRFGTKFPERGTCPCSRSPAAKLLPRPALLVRAGSDSEQRCAGTPTESQLFFPFFFPLSSRCLARFLTIRVMDGK